MISSSRRSSSWACTSWCPQWGAPQRWTWICWSQYLRKDHGFCGIMMKLHLWVSIPAPPWQVLAIPQRGSGREDWNWFFWTKTLIEGKCTRRYWSWWKLPKVGNLTITGMIIPGAITEGQIWVGHYAVAPDMSWGERWASAMALRPQ